MQKKADRILITGGSGFIGTNLISSLSTHYSTILNIDRCKPKIDNHIQYWHKGDILDRDDLFKLFKDFKPEIVIHLAARTDTNSNKLIDYIDNTEGTKNVIDATKDSNSVSRLIITSTQYVYFKKDKPLPASDLDFSPHTVYGESKVQNEQYAREMDLKCCWTIVRPTNVWGPWNMRYPDELLKMIKRGFYFHPGKKKVIKSYAFVQNLVHQLIGIIMADRNIVDKQVFYLGDLPMDSYEWVNSFSLQLIKRDVIVMPRFLLKILAIAGELLKIIHIRFPLTWIRFLNMTTDYPTPVEKTISIFGQGSCNHDDNVKETIAWLYSEGVNYFPFWKTVR